MLAMQESQDEVFVRVLEIRGIIGEADVGSKDLAFLVALVRIGIPVPRFLVVMGDDVVQLLVLIRDVEVAAAFSARNTRRLSKKMGNYNLSFGVI
jgi:hypothetical protein